MPRLASSFMVLALMIGSSAALLSPCDDSMGGDSGKGLRKTTPAAASWAVPLVDRAIRGVVTNEIFSWPKGTVRTGCTLKSYTWDKLCVPKNGKKDKLRAKLYLNSSCGQMHVKYRIKVSKSGSASVDLWGRSKS